MPLKVPAETVQNRTSEWAAKLPTKSKSRRQQVLSNLQNLPKPTPGPSSAYVPPPPAESCHTGTRTGRARSPVASNEGDSRPEFTDEIVILQNGPEPDAQSVNIRKERLDNATPTFHGLSGTCTINPKIKPTVFKMFITWLNHPEEPLPFLPCQYSREPWRSRSAVDAYLFAGKLASPNFEKYALSHIIRNCSLQDSSFFTRIETKLKSPQSALLRFSNHWVAWNVHLADEGQSEYKDLAAAKLVTAVTRDTNDPRIYDIEHWYSPCGEDINARCVHDPIVRENAVTALFASREPKPTWGLQWEEDNPPPGQEKGEEKEEALFPDEKRKAAQTSPKMSSPPPPLPPRTLKPIRPPRPKSS